MKRLHRMLSKVLVLLALVGFAATLRAQGAGDGPDLTGTWQGKLEVGQSLRVALMFTKEDGALKAVFYSLDQGVQLPATVTAQGATVKISMVAMGATFAARVSADGGSMAGIWTQGSANLPLTLTRAGGETAWALPAPPAKLVPMLVKANPGFEVATIKPSKPDQLGKGFMIRGTRVVLMNTTLDDMITFAYGLHAKQIGGAQPWMETEKFDVSGEPDVPGTPNSNQMRGMIQKLLADRFQLKSHYDKKELAVYALTPGKGPAKMAKSASENDLPGLFFRGLGQLNVTNATMLDFAQLMQQAVMDRPVVDQTGLSGRFDFTLIWTPDESQFAGMGAKVPPPSDKADAPPPLFTAVQEQLGLKLEPTRAIAQVFAIDHVQKPSEN